MCIRDQVQIFYTIEFVEFMKGVLTHKGRSIDSGHYIGWTKHEKNWVKFDDDKVSY